MGIKELAKTARLDIHPDFLGELLSRKKRKSAETRRENLSRAVQDPADVKYRKLLQSIYDAVLITDLKGRILDFNDRALDFFRCDDVMLAGASITSLIAGADEAGLFATIPAKLEEHRFILIDADCVRSDDSSFPAEIAVNRIDLENTGHYSFFVRDITERKRQQAVLEDAITRLEEHDRAKSLFVTNVSHELKTPLTSMIYAVANMLRGVTGTLPDRVRRYLELLDGDSKRMLATVNDILDLRKIDNKQLVLTKTRVPFARLVRRAVSSFDVQVEQKQLSFDIEAGDGKWFVECDAQKMERVVLNIAGNAVKFTPEGGDVKITVQDDPKRVGCVQMCVRDSGIGIPAEALPHVTDRYFTVGEQPSGSGLGLAITKEIVEMHGGFLEVLSPPPHASRGTQVNISIPVVQPPLLLVVDDDPGVRSLIVRQIEFQGYRVISAEDGEHGLERVTRDRPDAVVLDMVLPRMDGTEVILKMKSDKNTRHIPIIVVTGAHVGRGKAEILNSFSIPALMKPWQEPDLMARIEEAFLGAATVRA